MKDVPFYQFRKTIAEDLNIDVNQKYKTYFIQFPIKNGKRKINSFRDAIIVDRNGNEYPYMLDKTIRNEEKLIDFDYIYVIRPKNLDQLLKETGIKLRSKKCRIDEGGGWYSNGVRYYYKDFCCEV